MKTYSRMIRRDIADDHQHSLPDGHITGGVLYKPSHSDRLGCHTHLYQMDGKTHESSIAEEGPGHVHNTELGDTSAPQKLQKSPFEEIKREDSSYVQRRGRHWFVVSESGFALSRHDSAEAAVERLKQDDKKAS